MNILTSRQEKILELRTRFQEKPIESKNNVYIINDCEFLGPSAANSILKFLEEPIDDIIAILIVDNINLVLPYFSYKHSFSQNS